MESAEATVRYIIEAEVIGLYESSDGLWFANFAGSHESICLGCDKPDFDLYDHVRITIERMSRALPRQAPV